MTISLASADPVRLSCPGCGAHSVLTPERHRIFQASSYALWCATCGRREPLSAWTEVAPPEATRKAIRPRVGAIR
jgi:hypothetical protein